MLRLNTANPAVGITVPGAQWLPLLCAVRYGACRLGYRVTSDREVRILYQAEAKAWDDFYGGYPERLPSSPLVLEEGVYDPSNPENALFYAGVFGYDALSPEQFAVLAHHVEKDELPDMFGYETGEDYLREGNCLPNIQGPPGRRLPGPRVPQPRPGVVLEDLCDLPRRPARGLWGPNCGSLQIIYQICPACSAIRTTDQSD